MSEPENSTEQAETQPRATSPDSAQFVVNSSPELGGDPTNTNPNDSKVSSKELRQPLAAKDWPDVEQRFVDKMNELQVKESDIASEYNRWLKVFEAWATTTMVHDNTRAHKRLRTRIEHVRNSEDQLEQKREHYIKVVKAFQSALALLDPS